MTGFRSKRIMSVSRHADPETLDHLILLQKKLAKAERQCENALDHMIAVIRKNQQYKEQIVRLREALQKIADIEHEDIPEPTTPNEANVWTVLAMAVGLAEKALKETK